VSQITLKKEKSMMKKILFLVLTGMLLLSACGGGMKNASGKLEVRDYWARTAMKGGNGAAYMMIDNGTAVNHELIGASSDIADATELHLSKMENGVMQMVQQMAVALPAGEMVEFKPGGLHVMFIGLKQDLKVGDTITLTLKFKDHEDITLTVPVKDAADMGGSGMDGQMP
jgi:periplasmic copper chaperone A